MGFWKDLGKAALGTVRGVGGASIGMAKIGAVGARGIGAAPVHFASKSPAMFASAIGVGALAGAIGADATHEDVGAGAMKMGSLAFGAASLGGAAAVTGLGAAAVGTVGTGIGVAGAIGSSFINTGTGGKKIGLTNLDELKINKKGVVAMAAVGVIGGLLSAEKKFEQSRMGTNDGILRSATPVLPVAQPNQYENPGAYSPDRTGATGDLVFAMHNNR